jgi:predicted nucleic acid-binding protein
MHKIIVSDTSCLILLEKIGHLELLKTLFGKITITKVVAKEFGRPLPDYIQIENPVNENYQKILESILDSGEASSIALAIEKNDCLLIIDESKGRLEAKQLDINFTGTIGLLIVAKEKGYIKSLTEVFESIRKTNFRISRASIAEAIKRCGE